MPNRNSGKSRKKRLKAAGSGRQGSQSKAAQSKARSNPKSAPESAPESAATNTDPAASNSPASIWQGSEPQTQGSNYIPPEVSDRMLRRVFLFSGIPTVLGLGSFVVNYFLIVNDVARLPTSFTLIETLLLFGLGVLGITYGVLSASWDPEPGSRLGFSEFRHNLGNLIQEWRTYMRSKQTATPKSDPSESDSD